MTFDAADGYLLLFGGWSAVGYNGLHFDNSTWIFKAGIWTELSPRAAPSPRDWAAMTYDAADGDVVLFGGCGVIRSSTASCPPVLGDTWTFKGGQWSNVTGPISPSPRDSSAMTFDQSEGQVVLFGGRQLNGFLNDTWGYKAGRWYNVSPLISPSKRESFGLVYDPTEGFDVLFGGSQLADTWILSNGKWFNESLNPSPSARSDTVLSYDASLAAVVLFGGDNTSGFLNDTWEFKGGSWTRLLVSAPIPSRIFESMAFDSATGAEVLFGGIDSSGVLLGDSWVANWSSLAVLKFVVNPSVCPTSYLNNSSVPSGSARVIAKGVYYVSASNCSGYEFGSWRVEGAIKVVNSTSAASHVEVDGDGTLNSDYDALATLYFDVAPQKCGPLVVAGVLRGTDLPNILPYGIDSLDAPPCGAEVFSHWITTGNATVGSSSSPSTTLNISGNATVTATYIPASPWITTLEIGLGGAAIAIALTSTVWFVWSRRRGNRGGPIVTTP